MKTLLWILIGLVILLGAFYALNSYIYDEKQGEGLPTDYKEATFTISGEPVTLKDGVAQAKTALGGESMTTIRYFGNALKHDVNGDGIPDMIFLITQETGGSGTFFYAVAALQQEDNTYVGSKAVYIGYRIAPHTTNAGEGRIVIVNYADRKAGEPFTTRPSVGKSLYLLLDPQTLDFGEVVQNFEGESR